MKRLLYPILFLLILLICIPSSALAGMNGIASIAHTEAVSSSDNVYAEDLSKQCKYCMGHMPLLTDGELNTYWAFRKNACLRITWKDTVPVHALFLQFYLESIVPYTVQQFDASGTLLKEETGTQYYNNLFYMEAETQEVCIVVGDSEMKISTLLVYGVGEIPNYHPWPDRPEKADYMLIATHPDDDILFLGAVIPIYEGEQGRRGIEVFTCSRCRERYDEACNGAWTMGLRSEPFFAGYIDTPSPNNKSAFPQEAAVLYLVRLMRHYKPEVVVTQDENGEYGHIQHKQTVKAVEHAVGLAANPSYDPESAEQFGTWEVKKLYLHLYQDNPISLDIDAPLTNMNGKSAFEVAQDAFMHHKTQNRSGRYYVRRDGVYDLSSFGLKYSIVGLDSPGSNDMFENIDESALHSSRDDAHMTQDSVYEGQGQP